MAYTIPVYDVQTFYGAHAKTFQRRHHAEEYLHHVGRRKPPLFRRGRKGEDRTIQG